METGLAAVIRTGAEGDRTRQAWAKLSRAPDEARVWHSLVAHGIDVAAVFEALCKTPVIASRLETAARRRLEPTDLARLGVLACFHDFGKANTGFWGRQFEPRDPRHGDAGHITETRAALYGDAALKAHPALGLDRMQDWGEALEMFLITTLSHHGSPVGDRLRRALDAQVWNSKHNYDPIRELERLRDAAFAMFPAAESPGPPLPDAPRFVHLFAGLLMLADWIGSDPANFPLANGADEERAAFARERAHTLIARFGIVGLHERRRSGTHRFEDVFGWTPRPLQAALAAAGDEPLVILEAETGSGKTEAALWHFAGLLEAGLVDSLYFALPTRVAATEIHRRVTQTADALFGKEVVKPVLAVPGYVRAGTLDGQMLPGFAVLWPDCDEPTRSSDGRWAAESPKRFLGAPIAVGTIDQAFLAGLQTGHAHLRAAALARSLLVVDEVHASDVYMTSVLRQVLENHLAVGGRALLMSATLGAEARRAFTGASRMSFAEAVATPYPAITRGVRTARVVGHTRRKEVDVDLKPIIAEPDAIAALATAAARDGATIVIVRNTVRDALATQAALEAVADPAHLFRVAGHVTLHHGRFAAEDRRVLDAEVTCLFGKARDMAGRIVVGTQTLEQSLDLDGDLLITDLCPMDVLLQRIGRLHRHERARPLGYERARVVVLVPAERSLSPLLVRQRHGLGHREDGAGVYPDVRSIEATFRLLERHEHLVVPDMNRLLVEGATHPEALAAIVEELGWANEASLREGLAFASAAIAAKDCLTMSRPFDEITFPGKDEKVRTRLGLDDITLVLARPARTPFGQEISSIRVPAAIAKEAKILGRDLPDTIAVENAPDSLAFPEISLRYSRVGLTVSA